MMGLLDKMVAWAVEKTIANPILETVKAIEEEIAHHQLVHEAIAQREQYKADQEADSDAN